MQIYTIYKATNIHNGKVYIGFDSQWPTRVRNHKYAAESGKTYALSCAIRKYGWSSFMWEPIYQSTDRTHTLSEMESYFIAEYQSHVDQHGYNMSSGGEGNHNYTAEVRWKLGTSNRGKRRPHSEETKRKISEAKKGICTITDAHKEALRVLYTGRRLQESTLRKKSKDYTATSPDGATYTFFNLAAFCREHGLNQGAMSLVSIGKRSNHKGWTCMQVDVNSDNE